MWANPQIPVNLVTFTEEILNGKLHFCAVIEAVHSSVNHFITNEVLTICSSNVDIHRVWLVTLVYRFIQGAAITIQCMS